MQERTKKIRKTGVLTVREKLASTTGIPKVQIILIDIQRFGTPIDHIEQTTLLPALWG